MPPIINVARSQLGASPRAQREATWAPQIWKYKAATWLNPNTPWPWCVGFWQWTVKQAYGKAFPYQTASVGAIAGYARQHGLTTTSPKVGDAACFSDDHITFVDSLSGGSFIGLGGNQGDMVKRSTYSVELGDDLDQLGPGWASSSGLRSRRRRSRGRRSRSSRGRAVSRSGWRRRTRRSRR